MRAGPYSPQSNDDPSSPQLSTGFKTFPATGFRPVLVQLLSEYWLDFDALNDGDPLEPSGSYLVWENWNDWATIW